MRRDRLVALVVGALVLAALLLVPQYFDSSQTRVFADGLILAIAALGLNLLTGYNGQISIGHGAFYGVGAYTTAILMSDHGWRWLPTLPVVVVLLAVVGALAGFPALRVKGLYLALVTLGLAALFPDLTKRFVHGVGGTNTVQPATSEPLLRGEVPGIVSTPSWAEPFVDMDDQWRYYLVLATAVVVFVITANLVAGRFGRALIAVRDHETAAAVLGVNPSRTKIAAFSLSAVFAGIAGSCAVLVSGLANAEATEVFQQSIYFLIAVVVGGTATRVGPVIGGFVIAFLQRYLTDWVDAIPGIPDWVSQRKVLTPALFGIVLILLMYGLPDGLVGGTRRIASRLRRGTTRGPAAPSSAAA
jgi:branched-chain amino acid transport system permease protein